MALDDDIRVLSGVGLFKGLAEEHLRLLAFGAEKFRLAPGDTLYREGDSAGSAFVILSGRIDILRNVNGKPGLLTSCRPGTVLGEMSLIVPGTRPNSAQAAIESVVMSIEQRDFRRMLQEYPGVARRLHEKLAEEFQAMVLKLERTLPPE